MRGLLDSAGKGINQKGGSGCASALTGGQRGTPPSEGKLVAPLNALGQVLLSRAPSPVSASSLKTSRVLGFGTSGCPALMTPFPSVPCQETSSLLPVGNLATG